MIDFATFLGVCLWLSLGTVAFVILVPDRWYYQPAPKSAWPAVFDTDQTTLLGAMSRFLLLTPVFWLTIPYYYFEQLHPGQSFWQALPNVLTDWRVYAGWLLEFQLWTLAYVAAGLVWAVGYFGIYARRLGYHYVATRDKWLAQHGYRSMDDLPEEKVAEFKAEVVRDVCLRMYYRGDFPLNPFQQKRFFIANAALWPASMAAYFLGNFLVDVARSCWFTVRAWTLAYWTKRMALCLADQEACEQYLKELDVFRATRHSRENQGNAGTELPERLRRLAEGLQGRVNNGGYSLRKS